MPLPPSAIDAEHHLLGAIIRDSSTFPPDLLPSDFFEPKHQDIAYCIIRMQESGKIVDEMTVSEELRQGGSVVGAHYVSELTSHFSALNPAWQALILKAATLRRIHLEAQRIADYATDPAAEPSALLAHLDGSMLAVRSRDKPKAGPLQMDAEAMLTFDRKDDPNSVLGRRWLCKGGSLLMVGQSGTGKSSLMMQAAVQWSHGADFFGIKPGRPLRIVILQAENDFGDVSEAFQDCMAGSNLHETDRRLVLANLAIYRDTISVGPSFPPMLKQLILKHQADLIFVDPLLSFAGIDISDQEQASRFLRHDLAPILLETGAILIAMHHTGKPKAAADKEGQTVADLAYAGLGSSEFTNYFREVAVLFRCQGDQPIYKFGLTKRRGRAGLKDSEGQFKSEILIRHSLEPDTIRWVYSHPPSATDTRPTPREGDSSPAKGSPRRLKVD